MKQTYLDLNDKINYLNFFKSDLKDNKTKMEQLHIYNMLEKSGEAYGDTKTKQKFLKIERDYYKQMKNQKRLLTKHIEHLEEEIASLQIIIQLYEEKLI